MIRAEVAKIDGHLVAEALEIALRYREWCVAHGDDFECEVDEWLSHLGAAIRKDVPLSVREVAVLVATFHQDKTVQVPWRIH